MKLVVLVENTAAGEGVAAQHGLSLYIETGDQKLLFDMGQSDAFAANADLLGVDLSQVDMAVLSHGHYDHGGGLSTFLQRNTKAPVYIHEKAFGEYYNGTQKYIGLDHTLQQEPRLVFTKGSIKLSENILLTDCNTLGWTGDSWGLNRREGEVFLPDDFLHEQYLQITEGNRRILISGCSHKGILSIAGYFQPDVLIGGFHLSKQEDTAALQKTAEQLLIGKTVYYTGHCTGIRQFSLLKEIMGDRLRSISTGNVFEI